MACEPERGDRNMGSSACPNGKQLCQAGYGFAGPRVTSDVVDGRPLAVSDEVVLVRW